MKKLLCLFLCFILLSGCTQQNQSELDAGATTKKTQLSTVKFTANDPDNQKGLSTEKIEHSFGVAKNGQVHSISRESQRYFEEKGLDAVTYDTSGEKVLYLTFDCGYENGYTAKILDTLKEKNVKAAFFCTLSHIKAEPGLMKRFIDEGHIIGNHSATHPSFPEISRNEMAKEVEECDNYLRENFNYTSPYFRFPKGEYSESAVELVNSLGFKCVFWSLAYNDWNTDIINGEDYAFEKVTQRLHPGAIILLHSVSPDNAAAMGRIIDYARSQGYVFKSLNEL